MPQKEASYAANGSDAAVIDYEDIINHKQVFLESIFPIQHHLMSHELIILQPQKKSLKKFMVPTHQIKIVIDRRTVIV